MKNSDLAIRIKELSTRKGLSQDELATTCGLSLRTIQRIENGETEPRGDTLQRLALAFGVAPDELVDWAEQEDSSILVLLNLSALSYIAFPILGIVVPLAIWLLKKGKVKNLDYTAKKLINFQISWSIFLFIIYLTVFGSILGNFRFIHIRVESIILMIALMYIFNGIVIVVNSIRCGNNRSVFYPPAFPFLK